MLKSDNPVVNHSIKNESKQCAMIRILVLGSPAVGKTSFLERYSEGSFQEQSVSNIGIDFKIRSVMVDNKPIKLQIVSFPLFFII